MVQVHSGLPNLRSKFEEVANDGAIAQLGERLLCTQEVRSSILLGSTKSAGLCDQGRGVNNRFVESRAEWHQVELEGH